LRGGGSDEQWDSRKYGGRGGCGEDGVTRPGEVADGKICGVLDVASGLAFEARYSLWDSCLSATVVLMPVRPPVELWIDTIVAMVIGFLVVHAVDYNDPTNTKAPDLLGRA
jgi:hypothetical protein